jgi:hypothetical protein
MSMLSLVRELSGGLNWEHSRTSSQNCGTTKRTYSAINRMLARDHKPPKSWADRLTAVFGTPDWEKTFYSTTAFRSLLDSTERVELVHKSAGYRDITDFFINRLKTEFAAVSQPLPLHNSNGALLFMLFFAAGNERSAKTGLKDSEQHYWQITAPSPKHHEGMRFVIHGF